MYEKDGLLATVDGNTLSVTRSAVAVQEGDAVCSMYEKDGLLATEDGNIFIWAGATVGGGTRINW